MTIYPLLSTIVANACFLLCQSLGIACLLSVLSELTWYVRSALNKNKKKTVTSNGGLQVIMNCNIYLCNNNMIQLSSITFLQFGVGGTIH